jgi:hypothetical protein
MNERQRMVLPIIVCAVLAAGWIQEIRSSGDLTDSVLRLALGCDDERTYTPRCYRWRSKTEVV